VKLRAGSRNQFFDNTDSGGRDLEREIVLLLFASPHGQSALSDDVSNVLSLGFPKHPLFAGGETWSGTFSLRSTGRLIFHWVFANR
jgi:hypothetical protein